MSQFKTIEDVWAFLDGIPMFQKVGKSAANFSLDNIRAFCERIGNPQDQFPSIHVAGTNGKGTTCYLLEAVYSKAGYKTGLFTSPHLLRYHERVRVNQQEIPDEAILEFFQRTEALFKEIKLSYFEISTALAFWHFAAQNVDIAIIETGLGGRLDSTNIINPEISAITSIGLDHQNILGETLEEIAREKAGIVKKQKPVVVGNVGAAALNEILEIAHRHDSPVYPTTKMQPKWDNGKVIFPGDVAINTNFIEPINKWNVAVVRKIIHTLDAKFPVSDDKIRLAIEEFPGVPGRFEKLHPSYDWYFSGSHNEESLKSSIEAVKELKPIEETILVFSAMQDKVSREFLDNMSGFKKAFFVEQEGERAAKYVEIKTQIEAELMDENTQKNILKEFETELVIFMGSFYFYPIVKRWTSNVS